MSFALIKFSNLIEKSSIILNVIVYFSYYSPAAKGGNPQISGIVFLSLDYSSLGCI